MQMSVDLSVDSETGDVAQNFTQICAAFVHVVYLNLNGANDEFLATWCAMSFTDVDKTVP